MITVRKLISLSEVQRLRKIRRLCEEWQNIVEKRNASALEFYKVYLRDVLALLPAEIVKDLDIFGWLDGDSLSSSALSRSIQTLRNRLEKQLGIEAADWDFTARGETLGSPRVFPAAVYCEDFRSPFNLGSVLRSAWAFGFQKVYVSAECPSPDHQRVIRSAMGAVRNVSWMVCSLGEALADFSEVTGQILDDENLFCLETGGRSIDSYQFPGTGMAVLGNEELGIRPDTLRRCGARRVSIPLYGDKSSLNVGTAFGILAHRWTGALV